MKPSFFSMNRSTNRAHASLVAVASALALFSTTATAQQTPAAAPPVSSPASDRPDSARAPEDAPRPSGPTPNELQEQQDVDAPITEFDFRGAVISASGLTSDEAAEKARARAPQIASAEAVADSAYWDSRVVWSGFMPQVNAYFQYKRINLVENVPFQLPPGIDPMIAAAFGTDQGAFTYPENNYAVGASIKVPVLDMLLRVWPAYEASKNLVQARKFQTEGTADGVELSAREAYYAYVLALANRAVFEQSVKQAQAQRDQIQLFVDAGTVAPVDLMSSISRYEAARSALARAEGVVATSRSRLATLMGVSSEKVTTISEPVADLPASPTASSEDLVRRGLNQRPELKALRELVGVHQLQKKAERGSAMPQISLDGTILDAMPNPRYIPINKTQFKHSWELGGTVSWTPNLSLLGYQRSQRENAEIAKARADVMSLEDAVRIEVVQAYEDYKAADAQAKASQAQLRAAEEAYRVRLAMYRVGAGVVIDLLQEDLRVTEARLALANAAINARVAMARLKRAAVLD
jgi:outer membrane protein TolC